MCLQDYDLISVMRSAISTTSKASPMTYIEPQYELSPVSTIPSPSIGPRTLYQNTGLVYCRSCFSSQKRHRIDTSLLTRQSNPHYQQTKQRRVGNIFTSTTGIAATENVICINATIFHVQNTRHWLVGKFRRQ